MLSRSWTFSENATMPFAAEPYASALLIVGALLVVDLFLQAAARRIGVPSMTVHLALGLLLAVQEPHLGWLGDSGRQMIEALGSIGVVFLLFRVGLESNVRKLAQNLRRASVVWIVDVTVSGGFGYLGARYLLDLALVPSLFVAVAMSVTSVGVGVAVWREEGQLETGRGQLFLDVAELDDISGLLFMAVLFAVAPLLAEGQSGAVGAAVVETMIMVLLRLALFGFLCVLFARYVEGRLTRLVGKLEPLPDRLITVASVGLIVAAASSALGFSLPIGAFFAGLAFSRDPAAVKLDAYFDPLYSFFTPFFFITISLHVDPASFGKALPLGLLLLVVAVSGKLLGAGGGALFVTRPASAALLGFSMIPRAEVAMVIMQHGLLLGAWAVPQEVFAGMVVVSLLTCLPAPLLIRAWLRRKAATEVGPAES